MGSRPRSAPSSTARPRRAAAATRPYFERRRASRETSTSHRERCLLTVAAEPKRPSQVASSSPQSALRLSHRSILAAAHVLYDRRILVVLASSHGACEQRRVGRRPKRARRGSEVTAGARAAFESASFAQLKQLFCSLRSTCSRRRRAALTRRSAAKCGERSCDVSESIARRALSTKQV